MIFDCAKCGWCCFSFNGTAVTSAEAVEISRFTGLKQKDFLNDDKTRTKIVLGKCFFLTLGEGKSKCQIYNVRPDACKKFPNEKYAKPCRPINYEVDIKKIIKLGAIQEQLQ